MGRPGDEHQLRQVFRSHLLGGCACPGVGAGHGPGHVPYPRGHVQAPLPGLEDRRGLPPVVASHQRHPPGVPPVGHPGECAHHDLEMGGGLPAPIGVRPDGRPPPRLWTRTRRTTWSREPRSPSRMPAPATPRWGHRAMQMTRRQRPRAQLPSKRGSPRRKSGCGSRGKTYVWTSHAPGSRGSKAPRRCCSGEPPSRWRRPSASSESTSASGGSRPWGQCCPGV